jgi:hypothetical protein
MTLGRAPLDFGFPCGAAASLTRRVRGDIGIRSPLCPPPGDPRTITGPFRIYLYCVKDSGIPGTPSSMEGPILVILKIFTKEPTRHLVSIPK